MQPIPSRGVTRARSPAHRRGGSDPGTGGTSASRPVANCNMPPPGRRHTPTARGQHKRERSLHTARAPGGKGAPRHHISYRAQGAQNREAPTGAQRLVRGSMRAEGDPASPTLARGVRGEISQDCAGVCMRAQACPGLQRPTLDCRDLPWTAQVYPGLQRPAQYCPGLP